MKRQISLQSPTARSQNSKPFVETRAFFLKEFIRATINQVPEKAEWFEDMFLVKFPPRKDTVEKEPTSILPVVMPAKRITNIVSPPPLQVAKPMLQVKPQQKQILVRTQVPGPKPVQLPNSSVRPIVQPQQMNKPVSPVRSSLPGPNDNSLLPKTGSKIVQFLHDPAVIGLECPGPGKSIFVNRMGSILSVPIELSAEEIQAVLNEVSSETRIPLMSGVFKALYKSLMITAVVSDFTGTRFIIEKRPVQSMSPATPIRL